MKIYCALFDAMPFESDLMNVCENRSIDFHHQVSNCYTTTSVLSLLTALLPSQIVDGGVGYHTPEELIKNGKLWNDFILFDKLKKDEWKFFAHNSTWLEDTIFNKFKLERSTSLPSGVENEIAGVWGKPETENLLCVIDDNSLEMQSREIEHIRKIQSSKSTNKHEFHFLIYHHYHAAITKGLQGRDVPKKFTREIIEAWDFEEEDAIFWFFADHGDFTKIDKFSSPPHAWTTWAITRDNVRNIKSERKLISVLDFIPSLSGVLGIEIPNSIGESIYEKNNPDRIFLIEDSRAMFDLFKSTTAAAISCKEWDKNGFPLVVEQTSIFVPSREMISLDFNYINRYATRSASENMNNHILKLKKHFNWIT